MADPNAATNPASAAGYNEYRADLDHYWARLMWYRDELWRITIPVWGVYGAFIASCVGYVWSSEKDGRITGNVALMLIWVIVLFTWVILRMYQIYSKRIYKAISELNTEVERREQYLYDTFLKNGMKANYGRFKVYPKLHVIFAMIAITMAITSIFAICASVGFTFENKPPVQVVQVTEVSPQTPTPKAAAKTKKALKSPPAPSAAVATAAPATPAPASISLWIVAGICFALFLIFEFVLWVFHWRDSCEDGKSSPMTVKGQIRVDLNGRNGAS